MVRRMPGDIFMISQPSLDLSRRVYLQVIKNQKHLPVGIPAVSELFLIDVVTGVVGWFMVLLRCVVFAWSLSPSLGYAAFMRPAYQRFVSASYHVEY